MPLPPPPTLDDDSLSRLLEAFFSRHEPELAEVAYRAKLSIIQCAAWLAHPDTLEFIDNLHTAFHMRSRLLAAQALPHAIASLTEAAQHTHPPDREASASVRNKFLETSRRASSRIIDLYQFESRRCEGPTPRKPSRARPPRPIAPPIEDIPNPTNGSPPTSARATDAPELPNAGSVPEATFPSCTSASPHPTNPPAATNSDPNSNTSKPASAKYESPSVSTALSPESAVPFPHSHPWTHPHQPESRSPESRAPP